jgi:hypothetical protein
MAPGVDITSEGSNDSVVCRADGGGMSRDVFTQQIRVMVFVMTRLCANTEIGVPRGRIAFPRHSCEGRNLNQDMDALTYTPP